MTLVKVVYSAAAAALAGSAEDSLGKSKWFQVMLAPPVIQKSAAHHQPTRQR